MIVISEVYLRSIWKLSEIYSHKLSGITYVIKKTWLLDFIRFFVAFYYKSKKN